MSATFASDIPAYAHGGAGEGDGNVYVSVKVPSDLFDEIRAVALGVAVSGGFVSDSSPNLKVASVGNLRILIDRAAA